MDPNKSEKTTENNLLNEFDISSISSAGMDMKEMAEEIQKLKAEVQQSKDAANSNQFGGLLMIQIGEKFGKMEKEMDGLKSANRVEIQAFEELKAQMVKMTEAFEGLKAAENEENSSAFEELKEQFEKMAEENAGLKEKMAKMNEEFEGKNEEMEKMKAEIQGLTKENEDSKQRVGKLAEKNAEMKEEIGKMKDAFSVKNNELEVQIVGLKEEGQKLEKKTRQLEEQQKTDNGTFANLTERIDGMELIQLKINKWNAADCGPKFLIYRGEGLVVKHMGGSGWNCIRAISPIPAFDLNAEKSSIAGYFEMQILGKSKWVGGIQIGFCPRKFPLEGKWLGSVENSIGIFANYGMYINGQFKEFGNAGECFEVGDVIGVGAIHSPAKKSMICFGTLNGQLLVTLELPANFLTLQLFPAASLFDAGDSIHANFGQQKWRYDPSQLLK